jgi:CRP/FNR family cyclic AMP-dependent transcriptional regulator
VDCNWQREKQYRLQLKGCKTTLVGAAEFVANVRPAFSGQPANRLGRSAVGCEMSDNEVDFSLLLRPEVPTRSFAKGDTIFREGEPGDEFFVVVRGKVEIRGGKRCFETLGENGIFGEMALIDDSPRCATVAALTDVTVAPITENQFLSLVKHVPFFGLKVMRVLAYRLRNQNKAV